MRIGSRKIGPDEPVYVIAEIGVNHDGLVSRALELVDAAAEAGADAVKVQVFEAERLMSRASRLAAYQQGAGETDPVAMLRRLELPLHAMERIAERAHERGLHAIATVFHVELVPAAAGIPWDGFKSASPDIVNRPLLEAMAGVGRPLVVSTGAATMDEVERAARWLASARSRLAMLQCVSAYPTEDRDAAIEGVEAIARATGLPTGYSDHTRGVGMGAAAVGAGACILEKHLTHDRSARGPDHAASLDPAMMKDYIERAHAADGRGALGTGGSRAGAVAETTIRAAKRVLDCERDVRQASRQSLTTRRAMGAGERVAREDLTIKRPGTGVEPWRLDEIVGRTLARNVDADTPLTVDDLA